MRLGLILGFLCGLMLTNIFLPSISFAQSDAMVRQVTKLISLSEVYEAMVWSRDGKYFLLADHIPSDGRIHYCMYSTETLKKIKCIAALPKSEEMYVGGLDWNNDRIFFVAGYIEEPRLGWIDIHDWQKPSFREIEISDSKSEYVQGEYGLCPAWDEVEAGLFFGSTVEFGGVLFEKNKAQTVRLKTAICARSDARYIWYTEYGQQAVGIRRLNRKTGKVEGITEGLDFADSPFSVSGKEQVLFIRQKVSAPASNRKAVYGFSAATGLIGPLFGNKLTTSEEVQAVVINKAGDTALVSVWDKKNSHPGKNTQTILMFSLKWK